MMNKRIPTILGLVLLISGIAGGVLLVQRTNTFNTQASSDITPKNVQLSNITHESFTVSWSTDKSTNGFIKWGTDKNSMNNITSIDNESKYIHYIEVDKLSPLTTYYFHIFSNSKEFSNNQQPYVVTTGKQVAPKPTTEILSGKIITKTGLEVDSAIIYANISGGNTLSDISTTNGGWLIPISRMRSKDLSNYLKIGEEDVIDIFVNAGPLGTATAKVNALETDLVPPITLGEQSDFTNNTVEFNDEIPDSSLRIENNDVKSLFDFPFD